MFRATQRLSNSSRKSIFYGLSRLNPFLFEQRARLASDNKKKEEEKDPEKAHGVGAWPNALRNDARDEEDTKNTGTGMGRDVRNPARDHSFGSEERDTVREGRMDKETVRKILNSK
eukprot:TRINITY_DN9667_c0_g1_i1.p1 TRINITY_DN9667_c0_g1~~TRINITY_DN9667_c0_g1_i1.p1  ORF type:complete len:126 (-),score=24.76 TRINITY_DN9667_c0_g1_i1:14-361(-)